MALKQAVEAFECDPDFCPRCGSILPLPGLQEVVSCSLCSFQKDTSDPARGNHRVFWEDTPDAGSESQDDRIKFSGVPYMLVNSKTYDCQHGVDRNKALKRKLASNDEECDFLFKKRRFLVQNTKKVNCTARIKLREVIMFPDYKIEIDSEKRRKTASSKLRKDLADGKAAWKRRILVHMPNENAHQNHFIGHAGGISQPVDSRIMRRIEELVAEGVNDVYEMRRHIKVYVHTTLFQGNTPPATNRRFSPKLSDIRNQMYRATIKYRRSRIDQENVSSKVDEWKSQYEQDKLYFRPHLHEDTHEDDIQTNSEINSEMNDEGKEESVYLTGHKTSRDGKTLLFVHQTAWQRRLLERYGDVCLLDATYKTTKYALPLFFVAVKTNVDYQIVASFVTHDETTVSISEALGILREWNPGWSPGYFFTDLCEQEINAIESTFKGCVVFLCDFHREQAWERWVAKAANNVSNCKDERLGRMREIAHAEDVTKFNAAVDNLKQLPVWNENKSLQDWFLGTWLKQQKRWALVFRKDVLPVAINTTNGVERQNEEFKYNFLSKHRDKTLSGMLTVLIEDFLQDKYARYVEKNVRRHSLYKGYNPDVPRYLWNRPKEVVSHCLSSITGAEDIPMKDVKMTSKGKFEIRTPRNKGYYELTFGEENVPPACQCVSWQRTRLPCKHFFAVFRHYPEWQWNQLSAAYTTSPRLTLDEDVIEAPSFNNEGHVIFYNDEKENESDHLISEVETPDRGVEKHNQAFDSQPAKAESQRRRCRDVLMELRNLTFHIQDNKTLKEMEEDLGRTLIMVKKHVPSDGGLTIEQQASVPLKKKTRKVGRTDIKEKRFKSFYKELTKETKTKHKYSGRHGSKAAVMRKSYKVHIPTSTSPCSQHQAKFARPAQSIQQPKVQLDVQQNHFPARFSQPHQQSKLQQVSQAHSTPTSRSKSPQQLEVQMESPQPKVKQNSPPKPTSANCSQPPQQPKVKQNSPPKPTSANYSQPPRQPTVQQNSQANTFPTHCSQPSRLLKMQQNSLPKPTSASCSLPPQHPRVQQDCQPHPAPACSTQPTQTKPFSASCFQPPQKLKVKEEQHIHPTVQAIKVVQGSLNQQCSDFSEANRGKQCTSNSLTFLLHHATVPEAKIAKEMIDAVLKVGDKLHTVLTSALLNPGERLSLEEVQTAIRKIGEHKQIIFPQAIITGDVFSHNTNFPFMTLEEGLKNATQTNAGALLRILEYTVAVKKLTNGCFVLFDPHARNCKGFVDGTGTAIAMLFSTLDAMVGYLRTFVRHKGCEKKVPLLEDNMSLCERAFEVLAISADWGVDSILSRLLKGASQTRKPKKSEAPRPCFPARIQLQHSKEKRIPQCPRDTHPGNPVIVEQFGIKLTTTDFDRLRDGEQLNDQIINFYMELVNQRVKESSDSPKVHCFSSFFYETLSTRGAKWMAKWTKKINIFNYDMLFIPVHLPGHWALGVVDVNRKTISYWDGLQGVSHAFYKNIRCFLKDQSARRGRPFSDHHWLDEVPKAIPFQENNYDCGMFLCMFAENLSRGKNPSFHQNDMPLLRKKLKEQLQQKRL